MATEHHDYLRVQVRAMRLAINLSLVYNTSGRLLRDNHHHVAAQLWRRGQPPRAEQENDLRPPR
jgi:hypothetical protein